MKRLLLIIGIAMIVSGCEAFVHPYDMDWYQNPCKWYDKPEPGWYCKTHPPESE